MAPCRCLDGHVRNVFGSPTVRPASSSVLLHIYVPSHIWPKQNRNLYRWTFNMYKHRAERLTVHANVIFPTFWKLKKKNPAYFWFIKRQNYIQNIFFFFLNDNNIMTINTNMLYILYAVSFRLSGVLRLWKPRFGKTNQWITEYTNLLIKKFCAFILRL